MSFWTDLQSNLTPEQLKTLQESARTGGTTTRDGNAETGQMWDNPRDLGGGLYQDQSGGYYGGTKGVTYGYDPQGNYLGQRTNKGLGSQIWGDVGPVAMAAGAYALGSGAGLGGGAPPALGDTAALGGNQVAALSPAEGGGFFSNLFGSGAPQALGEAGGYGAGAGAGAGLFGAGASNYLMPAALVGNALIGAGAAKSAASTQAAAQQQANQLLAQQYQQQRADLQPYSAAGVNALSKFQGMADYTPFGTSQFQADPGYAFRLSEGQKALERSAAARGGLLSGGTGKRIAAYGQEAASQEYQNAFNRYQTERAAKLAPYQSLINVGQASAAGQANAAGNYGTQAAQGLTNIGGAQAAGTVAGANALASGLGQYLNYNANQDLATAVRQSGYGR
jgi:hypothetical protein